MIEYIPLIVILTGMYIMMAFISHNDLAFRILPNWLCIFCLCEKLGRQDKHETKNKEFNKSYN